MKFFSQSSKNNLSSKLKRTSLRTQYFWWRCGQGTHPFPSRTRWLRPDRPMVLHWRRCGRAGGRQTIKILIRLPKANEFRFLGRSLNEEKRTSIWKKKWIDLYQWSEIKKDFWFLMTDKHQSELYLENCIQRNIDDKIKKYLIKTSEVMLTNIN